ncbi:MAG TPA: DNA-binding protein, partial [Sphingobacterium sp.]|nr:DNA-binding protein [Sphingobacterium sp.]
MSKSQITFNKKEREKKKLLKKQQKNEKKEFNKTNNDKGKSLEELFAYVDEYGNISDKPPVKLKEGE